jgi:hypothetical protein
MRSAFAQVQAFLVEHRGQFIDREGDQSEVPLRMLGDRLEDVDGVRWSRLTVAAWHLACEGWQPGTKRFDSRIVARAAVAAGMVRPAFSGAPYQMTSIPPLGRIQVYIVRESAAFASGVWLDEATGSD